MFVFSHGFGTDKTDRGLFTDIANALGVAESCIMVEYNEVDSKGNTTVHPLSEQAKKLEETLEGIEEPVNLICHSQGCLVAALAGVKGIQSVLFLAPATSTDSFMDKFKDKSTVNSDGDISIRRSDGSITHMPAHFLMELNELYPEELYKDLSERTMLTIIYAQEDADKGRANMPSLQHKADINLMKNADHNFSGESRERLIALFKALA